MPTRFGAIFAQWNDWRFTTGPTFTATVRPLNRNITARAAVTAHFTGDRSHGFQAWIARIISNDQVTEFSGTVRSAIQADNVTEIVFQIDSNDATTYANFTIDYWS